MKRTLQPLNMKSDFSRIRSANLSSPPTRVTLVDVYDNPNQTIRPDDVKGVSTNERKSWRPLACVVAIVFRTRARYDDHFGSPDPVVVQQYACTIYEYEYIQIFFFMIIRSKTDFSCTLLHTMYILYLSPASSAQCRNSPRTVSHHYGYDMYMIYSATD